MFLRINSILPIGNEYRHLSIFGYRSHGVPGLDVKGLPISNIIVKEKLVYLSKLFGVKIPMRRFHLCVDIPKEVIKIKKELIDDRLFELPLLLLFWSLADLIKLYELENCFALGKIDSSGKVEIPAISETYLQKMSGEFRHRLSREITFIKDEKQNYESIRSIEIQEIMRLN